MAYRFEDHGYKDMVDLAEPVDCLVRWVGQMDFDWQGKIRCVAKHGNLVMVDITEVYESGRSWCPWVVGAVREQHTAVEVADYAAFDALRKQVQNV